MGDQPFPFLKLPKELRLMVYERLPVTTRHHTWKGRNPFHLGEKKEEYTIVTKTLPAVAMLRTCRLIHGEATKILAPRLDRLRQQPIQYIFKLSENIIGLYGSSLEYVIDMTYGSRDDQRLDPNDPDIPSFLAITNKYVECETRLSGDKDEAKDLAIVVRDDADFSDEDISWTMGSSTMWVYTTLRVEMPQRKFSIALRGPLRDARIIEETLIECNEPHTYMPNVLAPTTQLDDQIWADEWEEGDSL